MGMVQERKKDFAISLIPFLIAFALFLPSLNSGFVNWDDNFYVYENPNIRSLDLDFFKWVFPAVVGANWHPITIISYALDYLILGLNPSIYHFTNILLHSINTSLVFIFACRLLRLSGYRGGIITASLLASMLFGIHPLHVESVSWISERKDVLCGLFFLLSIIAYLDYKETGFKRDYTRALTAFVLALMSKPMTITLPVVLLLLDFYLEREFLHGFKKALYEKAPFFILSIASAVITLWVQGKGGAIRAFELVPLQERLIVAVSSYAFYLYKLLFPLHLSNFYPYPEKVSLLSLGFILSFALISFLTSASIFYIKKRREFFTIWSFYLITLLPVIGIVQVGSQAAADRYMYLPSLSLFLFAGALAGMFTEKKIYKTAVFAFSGLALFILSALNLQQQAVWKDSVALWDHETKEFPAVSLGYYNRGCALDKLGLIDRAITDYSKAIELDPGYLSAYLNRGFLRTISGDYDKAIKDFDSALSINPRSAKALANKGYAFLRSGDFEHAAAELKAALTIERNGFNFYNLGLAYAGMGEPQKAKTCFTNAESLGFRRTPSPLSFN